MALPAVLTIDEVAAVARVCPPTVRAWISQGRLRAARPGRKYLVTRADLDALLTTPFTPESVPDAA